MNNFQPGPGYTESDKCNTNILCGLKESDQSFASREGDRQTHTQTQRKKHCYFMTL